MSRLFHLVVALAAILLATTGAAQAGPVFFGALAAGAPVGSAFAATAVGTFLASTVGRLLTTVALTALQSALAAKPKQPGLVTEATQSGGTNPVSFILGRYATAGTAVCPAMSHGNSRGKLTYVIDLGDIPITGIARLALDGEYVPVDWGGTPHPEGYGYSIGGRYDGWAWVKFRTGQETTADPMLLAKYGSYPERPWLSDMIGRGVPHLILTFRFDTGVYQGLPSVLAEGNGLKVYDPRKDTTVGGSGAHRWATPTTWEWTDNPAVMIYNILRGITLADGSVWGGRWQAEDLPLDVWFAAMNACDAAVALDAGGTEPRYSAGYEVRGSDEPADVIEELLKGCAGRITFPGGQCKIRIGGPGLPVYFLTDDDILASRPEDYDPFPGLEETHNGVQASYPEPESLWEAKDAPPRYNATWEIEDQGRRRIAELTLPTVSSGTQAQRLMRAWIEDARRFRRHSLNLPPEAAVLEPLDTIVWTSARNGYSAKLFEVGQTVDDLMTMIQGVAIREVDATDFDWTTADELPATLTAAVAVEPPPFEVVGFAVAPEVLTDGTAARRPALALTWTGDEMEGARGLLWEAQRVGDSVVLAGSTQDVAVGRLAVSEGILAGQPYVARARLVADAATVWTAWTAVTAPVVDVLVGEDDPTGDVSYIQATVAGVEIVNASFAFDGATASETMVTTSQTLTLDPAAALLSLFILAGGSGPRTSNLQTPTNTVVALYDGGVATGISWTSVVATGGAGFPAGSGGGDGRSTNYGLGGRAAGNSNINATGHGAGGGGHNRIQTGGGGGGAPPTYTGPTDGGAAAGLITVTDFDLTPYAAPSLVITIGQKGRDRLTGTSVTSTSDGSPGLVVVTQKSTAKIPAGVIPLAPTATGTFTKAASATGGTIFPNLGPGLWVLTTDASTTLCLNAVEIDTAGTQVWLANALSASFVANKRPVVITGNATARTIRYAFYRMTM